MSNLLLGTQKDEYIAQLKKKNSDQSKDIDELKRIIESFKKGDVNADSKIKTLNELHAQKVKSLLKSINNLKKEVQKEKSMQKDNVRAQVIERLKKDISDQEVIINALRKEIGDEDQCDRAILKKLNSGPNRIRIASREELKMEINKLKHQVLRSNNSTGSSTNLKKKKSNILCVEDEDFGGEDTLMEDSQEHKENEIEQRYNEDYNEKMNEMNEEMYRYKCEISEKNDKLLELLNNIDDHKAQLLAKNHEIELQRVRIDSLEDEINELRNTVNEYQVLAYKKVALEEEIEGLRLELRNKIERDHGDGNMAANEIELENKGLLERLASLQNQLDKQSKIALKQINDILDSKSVIDSEKNQLQKEKNNLENKLKKADDQIKSLQKLLDTADSRKLNEISEKDDVINSQLKVLDDLHKTISEKEFLIKQLKEEIDAKSHELMEKNYEIAYYHERVDEFKAENEELSTQMTTLKKKFEGQEALSTMSKQVESLEYQVTSYKSEIDKLRIMNKAWARKEAELLEEVENLKEERKSEIENIRKEHLLRSTRSKSPSNRKKKTNV